MLEQLFSGQPLVFVKLQALRNEVLCVGGQVLGDLRLLRVDQLLDQVTDIFDLGPWVLASRELDHGLTKGPNIASRADRLLSDDFGRHPQYTSLDVFKLNARVTNVKVRNRLI